MESDQSSCFIVRSHDKRDRDSFDSIAHMPSFDADFGPNFLGAGFEALHARLEPFESVAFLKELRQTGMYENVKVESMYREQIDSMPLWK